MKASRASEKSGVPASSFLSSARDNSTARRACSSCAIRITGSTMLRAPAPGAPVGLRALEIGVLAAGDTGAAVVTRRPGIGLAAFFLLSGRAAARIETLVFLLRRAGRFFAHDYAALPEGFFFAAGRPP